MLSKKCCKALDDFLLNCADIDVDEREIILERVM